MSYKSFLLQFEVFTEQIKDIPETFSLEDKQDVCLYLQEALYKGIHNTTKRRITKLLIDYLSDQINRDYKLLKQAD